MLVISQDRDSSVTFNKGNKIDANVVFNGDTYMGINLIVNKRVMGTFDTLEEILAEVKNIYNCVYDFYVVEGFRDYEECFEEDM